MKLKTKRRNEKIREFYYERGYSQQSIARIMHISQPMVSMILS